MLSVRNPLLDKTMHMSAPHANTSVFNILTRRPSLLSGIKLFCNVVDGVANAHKKGVHVDIV